MLKPVLNSSKQFSEGLQFAIIELCTYEETQYFYKWELPKSEPLIPIKETTAIFRCYRKDSNGNAMNPKAIERRELELPTSSNH